VTQLQYKRGVLCTGKTPCDTNLPVYYTVPITRLLSRNVVTVLFWPLMFVLSVAITIVQIFTSQQKHSVCGFSSTKINGSIPFIFNDESTGSCIWFRLDLYMSHVKKHETVTICASADSFNFSYSPTHRATRAHTAVNVPAVTSYHGAVREISKVTRNKRRLRHIHVKITLKTLHKCKRSVDHTTSQIAGAEAWALFR
jgi:hypothetical protein